MIAKPGNETFENLVATFVDVGSILLAYGIGVGGYGIAAGLAYAAFDAFIVVWMRTRMARLVRRLNPWKAKPAISPGQRSSSGIALAVEASVGNLIGHSETGA